MTNRLTRAAAKCPGGATVKPGEGLRYVLGNNGYVWCDRCKARTAHRRRMCLTRAAGSATIATGPRQTINGAFSWFSTGVNQHNQSRTGCPASQRPVGARAA